MASKKKQNIEHIDGSGFEAVTIPSPGIAEAIDPPLELAGSLVGEENLRRFEVLAEEGRGRYKQEDAPLVWALANAERELEGQLLGCDMDPKLVALVVKLREKLGALPPQRFSQASRQRGAETYKRSGAPRSLAHAAYQAMHDD